jgi:hypothetical protein
MLLMPAFAVQARADEDVPMTITIDGPTVVGVSEVKVYKVTVFGGPAESNGANGTYSYKATLSGSNTVQAKLTPGSGGPTRNGTFNLTFTAPSIASGLSIVVTATSSNATANLTQTQTININVVVPVVLSAKIKNTGNVSIVGVPVYFFLDHGQLGNDTIYNTTVNINSNATVSIMYNWTQPTLAQGANKIIMVIDPNSQFVTFEEGGSVKTVTVYYGDSPYGLTNSMLWILIIILAVLAFLVWRRPSKKKGRKGKK